MTSKDSAWSQAWLDSITWLFEYEINKFKKYSVTVEDLLAQKLKGFTDQVDKQAAKLSKEERDEFYEYMSDEHSHLSETFPNTLRESLFLATYSYMENTVRRFCSFVQEHYGYKISVKDLSGHGIQVCFKYLEKVAEAPFDPGSTTWDQVKFLNDLRNIIVHSNGEVNPHDKSLNALRAKINRWPSVQLGPTGRIELNGGFNDHALAIFEKFFFEIKDAITKYW